MRVPGAPVTGAPIDAALVHASPARLTFESFFRVLVELEIAFRFAYALPARTALYTRGEVLGAIGGVAVGLEGVDSRFAQWAQSRSARAARRFAEQRRARRLGHGALRRDRARLRLSHTLYRIHARRPAHCALNGEPFWTITTGSYTGAYRVDGPAMLHGAIDRIGELEIVLGCCVTNLLVPPAFTVPRFIKHARHVASGQSTLCRSLVSTKAGMALIVVEDAIQQAFSAPETEIKGVHINVDRVSRDSSSSRGKRCLIGMIDQWDEDCRNP